MLRSGREKQNQGSNNTRSENKEKITISLEKEEDAVEGMKLGKSAGVDDITAEMVTYAGNIRNRTLCMMQAIVKRTI